MPVTPIDHTYAAESGVTMHIGEPALIPAWNRNAPAFVWDEVPMSNTLDDINPKLDILQNPNWPNAAPWDAISGWPAVVTGYGGGAPDLDTDEYWFWLFGGHGDLAANNPLYANFRAEIPTWESKRPPSGALNSSPFVSVLDDGQQATGRYSDGRPRAIHAYNKPLVARGVPIISVQGDTYPGQAGTNEMIFGDPDTGESTFAGTCPSNMAPGTGSCYDPLRHMVWLRSSDGTRFYRRALNEDGSPGGGAYEAFGDSVNISGYSALTYIPGADVIFWVCDTGNLTRKFAILDCATGAITQPLTTGAFVGSALHGKSQPRWIASLGAMAFWDNSSSLGTVNLMTPTGNPRSASWTISQLAGVTGAPTAATVQGTFGRFWFSDIMQTFFVLNATNQPTYFLKLA